MIRALSILATVAALGVAAAPAASAGTFENILITSQVKAAPPKPPSVLDNNAATDDMSLAKKAKAPSSHKKGHRPHKNRGNVTVMWDITSSKA